MTPDLVLKEHGITLRIGHEEIPPGQATPARVAEAVEKSNTAGRLPGLSDELNPMILDPAKVSAFVRSLPRVAPAELAKLDHRVLLLNDTRLRLQACSAIPAGALAQGYSLIVDDPAAGNNAGARLQSQPDWKLARDRANEANQTMEMASHEMAVLEKRKRQPNADSSVFVAYSQAQQKRYAAAVVWRDLTTTLAQHYPDDAALQAEAKRAKDLASKYIVAPWTGMP